MSAYDVVAAVPDPELRPVTIADLGVLRSVAQDPQTGQVEVTITPTYSGCPAMDLIRGDILRQLAAAGYPKATVRTVLAPAWTTEMITEAGRVKLAAAGIAPPSGAPSDNRVLVDLGVRCPRCSSTRTREISRFGATACKALWRCDSCSEPFERVKAL